MIFSKPSDYLRCRATTYLFVIHSPKSFRLEDIFGDEHGVLLWSPAPWASVEDMTGVSMLNRLTNDTDITVTVP